MKIAIVGAGIAGVVSAYMAARAGHEVVVFEGENVGDGASGRALGVLVPSSLGRKVDVLQREGVAAWPQLIEDMAQDAGVAVGEVWRDWGGGRQQLRVPEVLEVAAKALQQRGGMLRNAAVGVDFAQVEGCEVLLLAAGWGNKRLAGGALAEGMKMSAGQALRLAPPAPFGRLVVGDKLFVVPGWVAGSRGSGVAGTEVLVGSVNWPLREPGDGVPKAEVTEELLRRAVALAPELEGSAVVEAWVGYRPVSDPRLPLVREIGSRGSGVAGLRGVWAVAGLGKVGMGLAPVVGRAFLAEVEAGDIGSGGVVG
ncbi:MAG: FAD-dependent oxidoreductase [Proteobacteria bacterium]|nr:FAD-dependent oxidoreductase [Pseudomonadota bacterium]